MSGFFAKLDAAVSSFRSDAASNLEAMERKAQQESKKGYVQHVNEVYKGVYKVEDWYDSDQTVASFENGVRLDAAKLDGEFGTKMNYNQGYTAGFRDGLVAAPRKDLKMSSTSEYADGYSKGYTAGQAEGKKNSKTDADKKPMNGDYGTKYNAEAVQKEINKDKRIGGKEAKAIHALLKGRHDSDQFGARLDAALETLKSDASDFMYQVSMTFKGQYIVIEVKPKSNAQRALCFKTREEAEKEAVRLNKMGESK